MSLLDFSGFGTITEVLLSYMQEKLSNPHMESSQRRRWLMGSNTCRGLSDLIDLLKETKQKKKVEKMKF